MRRLREESRALDQADEQNERERKRLQGELKALRQKRRAEDAAASVAEEERAKKKKAEDEAAAKEKAEEAEAQRKADEEEARRIAEEKEAQLQKAMEFADQLQKEAEKAERKAQKAATKAEREPEESDQKAKKVRKAEKAKAKAELAMSKLKAERGAVSNLRWHGNRVGMPRIDFLHDKPEGWKEMWNQRLAAWKARHSEAQKKEDKEKAKGEQPDESGDKKKKSEPERPGHRLEAQRKIPMAQDPWSRPTVFWNQSWTRICELSRKKEGEGFVFFCGSQGCRKTFKNELAYWQHLWSKCDTPGHPSREIVKRWSNDKPFVAVSGDPDHPDPQWVEKQQKELKEKMRKEIQDHEDEKAKEASSSSRERERSPRVPSLDRQIQKMMTRSARQPRKLGLLLRVWDRLVRKTLISLRYQMVSLWLHSWRTRKLRKQQRRRRCLQRSPQHPSVSQELLRLVSECWIRLWMRLWVTLKRRYHLPRGMPSLDFQSHRPHQPVHQRRSPRVWRQRRLRQRFHLQVSQFLRSPSRMSQRIMIASWKLAKLVLVAAELIRT